MSKKPHFIGCDGGSTDPGPFPLGSGTTAFGRTSIKRDIKLMLIEAQKAKIPLFLGTAGTSGGHPHVAIVKDIIEEIAVEENLHFPMAVVHAEQDKEYLKKRLKEGRIKPLYPAPEFNEETIEKSERIVGMMGEEPFMKALDNGAEVVLTGRSSDCAIYAGIPVRAGIPPGIAWHAAKILECGTAAVEQRKTADSLFATCRSDHFDVEACDPDLRCTPQSVASHSLYENGDPFRLIESNGTMDLSTSKYEALDDKRVRVSYSSFEPAERYTVKLEGAELVGYQTIVIGGVRDPYILRQLDSWLASCEVNLHKRIADVYGDSITRDDYNFNIRVYGRDGVMGPLEPQKELTTHEVCLILEATAATQEIATSIATIARHKVLHEPIPEWSGLITGLACTYSPAHIERGAVYRFNVNHVVEPDDPYEMFPIDYMNVN